MGVPARHDIEAGKQLSSVLAQLNYMLAALAQLSVARKRANLACTAGVWQGITHSQFEGAHGLQEFALRSLASRAVTIKAMVAQATQQTVSLCSRPGERRQGKSGRVRRLRSRPVTTDMGDRDGRPTSHRKGITILKLTPANFGTDIGNEISVDYGANLAAEMNVAGPRSGSPGWYLP